MKLVSVDVGEVIASTVCEIDQDRLALVETHKGGGFAIGIISHGSYPRERSLTLTPEAFTALLTAMMRAERELFDEKTFSAWWQRCTLPGGEL